MMLKRFVIQCEFCGKKTDCLAKDLDDSIEKFKERGWNVFDFQAKEPFKKIGCRHCSYKLKKFESEVKNEQSATEDVEGGAVGGDSQEN